MDHLNPSEQHAANFLRHLGFTVTPIPRASAGSTPDLAVELDAPHYVVEVKSREDNDAFDDLIPGEVRSSKQHLNWSLTVLGQAKKAVRQFTAHDPSHERFWIVWYEVDETPFGGDTPLHQVRGTLLGSHEVVDLATISPTGATSKDVFYAQRGVFERYPQIDAAILAGPRGYEMWVNEFGRPDLIRACRLGQLFANEGALHLPQAHADAGRAYVLEGGRGQRTDADVIAYLRERCGVRFPQLLFFRHHAAVTAVDRPAPLEGAPK